MARAAQSKMVSRAIEFNAFLEIKKKRKPHHGKFANFLLYLPIMQSETVSIDTFGRVLIPKRLRTELNLEPQTQLEIQIQNGSLLLSPRQQGEVIEQDGIFVWTGADIPDSIEQMIAASRDERINELE